MASRVSRPRRFWLVANPASHSTSEKAIGKVRAALEAGGGQIVGETDFGEGGMPSAGQLDAVRTEVLVAYGGDGTVTCAATELANWDGMILALPGGTMNLASKDLHGKRDAPDIIAAVFAAPAVRALPYVEVGSHRAYARVIAGPAASLVDVRERLRSRRLRHAWRALGFAWRIMGSRSIGIEGRQGRFTALIVHAMSDDRLAIDPVEQGGLLHAFRLAWSWLGGLLLEGGALVRDERPSLTITADGPVTIVIDGESRKLDTPLELEPRGGRACFLVEGDSAA